MTADSIRESQARTPFDPLHGEALAQAILTRRRRLCIAEETHADGGDCARCGL